MNRRRFLSVLSSLTAGTAALAACGNDGHSALPLVVGPSLALPAPLPPLPVAAALLPPPPADQRVLLKRGPLMALPGKGASLALTVDDGTDPAVVAAYIKFAQDTGARFTFFVTASYPAWTQNRDALRPLVESGQIQLGNHTWSHPDLTTLTPAKVADQLLRTRKFLSDNYGVDGGPYYRPPYGRHNPKVDRVAADLGFTVPTLWYGSLSDSSIVTTDYLLGCARKYFAAQAIVIGHANHPAVTKVYPQLIDIIKQSNLAMVTLNDVLIPPS
jgi:peptidoglycan/xylan/chitin deacetylase (PgdA/CDA1 family)